MLLSLLAAPASAFDWTAPHPGLRVAEVVRPGPTVVHVAEVDTCAPGVSFRMTSPDDLGSAQVTSRYAASVGVQLATNGDFYDHDFGMNLGNGVDWRGRTSVSDARDRATSGTFAVGRDRIELYPTDVVFPAPEPWMQEVVGGRWTLVRDGVGQYGIADGGFVCSPGLRHPRTIVATSEDGRRVWLLVGDGRGWGGSVGLTCDDAIDLLLELGAWNAMGLDGGGSSTMVLDGEVLNLPTDGRERSVLNHVGVYALGDGPAPHCGERPLAPYPSGNPGAVSPVGVPARLVLAPPVRVVDTRHDAGPLRGAALDGAGRLGTAPFVLDPGVPADATAVLANVTVTGPAGPGFLSLWPAGGARPGTSVLNWGLDDTVGNAALVATGPGGLAGAVSTPTHLVVDVQGWLAPAGLGFHPAPPARLLDTRAGAPLAAGEVREVVPPLAADAVTLSVAAVDPQGPGFVTVWPCDLPAPATSNLNFDAGEVAAASVTVAARAGVCARSHVETDLVVDATGAWSASDGLAVQAVVPTRVLDTRTGEGRLRGRLQPDQVARIELGAVPGWPADGEGAALVLTVTQPTDAGFLVAWPCDEARPATSAANFAAGQTVAVTSWLGAGPSRAVCLAASASTHLVVDLGAALVGAPTAARTLETWRPAPGDAVVADAPPPGVLAAAPGGCRHAPGGGVTALLLALAACLRRGPRPGHGAS